MFSQITQQLIYIYYTDLLLDEHASDDESVQTEEAVEDVTQLRVVECNCLCGSQRSHDMLLGDSFSTAQRLDHNIISINIRSSRENQDKPDSRFS